MSTPPRQRAILLRPPVAAILGAWWWAIFPWAMGGEIDFYRDVYPILKSNCIACHNKTTTKAGLSLESPESMRQGGDSGEGVILGKASESLIYQAAAHIGDIEMPPKGNKSGASDLRPQELALLKAWIDQGAKSSVKRAREVVWQPLPPGVNPIYSVVMTRDGRLAACGRADQVFIYDLATRQLETRLAAHRSIVQSLAFSPDGMRLASGSFREVKIWRRETVLDTTGKTIPTGDPCSKIALLSLSREGMKVAVYGADGSLTVWGLAEGQCLASKDGACGVRALAWTRDGNAIATGGEDKIVRIWPVPAGDEEFAAAKELKGATGAITAIDTGSDLLTAATADGKVQFWSLSEAKPFGELAIAGVVALGLSDDGKRLAAGRADGVVQVWDLATGKSIIDLIGDAKTSAHLAALDEIVAAQGLEIAFQNEEAARLEAQSKGLEERLKKANETIAAVKKDLAEKQKDSAAIRALETHLKDAEAEAQNDTAAQSRNKSAIAAAHAAAQKAKEDQGKAKADADAIKKSLETRKLRPLAVRFSSDAQTVAAAFSDGSLRVWEVASGQAIEHVSGRGETTAASLVACPDGVFESTIADGSTTRVGTMSRWVLERTLGGDSAASPFVDRVNALRFSPDGKILAAGGGEATRSGDISLWDVASGRLIHDWKEWHSDAVVSLDFSPDGKQLASGGADKIARVTDIPSGKVAHVLEGHTHHVLGVSFRADGRVLATAGGDGVVVIWDMISGERKKKIEGWSKEVTSLQFIGASNQIVTSAGDNQVRIVDDRGAQVRAMAKLPDFMQSAASAATASIIIGGGEDSLLRVWNGTTGQELAIFGAESQLIRP
jgi:WD40 repeat protein